MEFEDARKVLDAVVFNRIGRHLSDPEQTVFTGAWQGKTYEEIAEITGCNLGTVKSRLNRARNRFAQIIEQIDRKLFVLPPETIVMPGHGLDTTVGTERPHLDEWIERGW